MRAADEFSEYYADLLEGSYDCVDRLVVNAYFSLGMMGGGLRSWWRALRGDDSQLDDEHLRNMAGTFSRRLTAFCVKHKIPLIDAQAGERKHEIAAPFLPKEANFQGLFLVITGTAPAPVWEIQRHAKGHIVDIRHRKRWPYVKHYFFHLIDPHWGHVTIRMCGYPPFGAQIILNGHEWVERQARRRAHRSVVKCGNCFVEGSDYRLINRLAEHLQGEAAIGHLREVCERWLYSTCLIFALTREEQLRSRFAYQYSLFQLELSRNLLFVRGTCLDEIYQKLIDRTRQPLQLRQLKTIFGFSHRPQHRITRGRGGPEVAKIVQASRYDLTVFKLQWGNLTLKIYDKGARVLRIEVVVHNAKELRCGKVLDRLPVLLERMNTMLVRFLATVHAAHLSFLDQGAFEHWSEPTIRGERRLAGIDLDKARNRHVLDAVVSLSTQPTGFTVAEVAAAVRSRSGWCHYGARHAAYDLTKLCGKKLIERPKRTRRFHSDPQGMRTMCAYLVLREQVIKPLLAGVARPRGRPPKHISPVDQHYMRLREELDRTFETLGLAA